MFDLQKVNYNIKHELLVRKILEKGTEWDIEFNENYENIYEYDLRYYKHQKDNSSIGFNKKLLGYVEIEICMNENWDKNGFPSHWEISFLKRKVYKYDFNNEQWSDLPKENYKRTVYLKFNRNLNDCFLAPISEIFRNGKESNRSRGGYNNSFLYLPLNKVVFGLNECLNKINIFFKY